MLFRRGAESAGGSAGGRAESKAGEGGQRAAQRGEAGAPEEEEAVVSQAGWGLAKSREDEPGAVEAPESLTVLTQLRNGPAFAPALRAVSGAYGGAYKRLARAFGEAGCDEERLGSANERLLALVDSYAVDVGDSDDDDNGADVMDE